MKKNTKKKRKGKWKRRRRARSWRGSEGLFLGGKKKI
jgi:hypothetical protein